MFSVKRPTLMNLDKSSKFVERVLFASLPLVFVFLFLVIFGVITPFWAIISYAAVVTFNVLLLLPPLLDMQKLKKYISSLSLGDGVEEKALELSEAETKDIVEAVNAMHHFWADKTGQLKARSMSDTAVLDSLPDPVLMLDRSGNILGANLSARKMLGDDILEKNIEVVLDSHTFIAAVSKVLNRESDAENLIFYVKNPTDQKIYAHIKSLPWISKNLAIAVVSLYDLSKVVRIEKMQSDFVANASHELRTPLSILSGFIETLQTSAKNDKKAQEQFLAIMKEQTEYMSNLIENLLSLSKIEMNLDQVPNQKILVAEVLKEASQAMSIKAAARSIKIELSVDNKNLHFIGDNYQIKQVVQNLLDNAIKYGLANSVVLLSAYKVEKMPQSTVFNSAKGEAIAIAVSNQGPKISNENLVRLTERFYRLQEHKDLNIKGTGLGLSIAKQIILHHRGNLTVNSNNYSGTTFTIYLPIKKDCNKMA